MLKIAPVLRMKRLVPSNVMITLYKAYVLLHFEYCSPFLLAISRTLNLLDKVLEAKEKDNRKRKYGTSFEKRLYVAK